MSISNGLPSKLKVFVCYERDNRALVQDLMRSLGSATQLIVDDQDWAMGESLGENQQLSIADADYVIAFLSPSWKSSVEVKRELRLAFRRRKQLPREFIIPVLLKGVKGEDLPAQFKQDRSLWLSCETSDSFLVQAKGLEILAHMLRLVGRHFREASEKIETKSRLAGVDFKSLRQFYSTCRESKEGVFFNSTVSMDEWFQPNLQIHLAVQDGMVHGRQMETVRALEMNGKRESSGNREAGKQQKPMFSRVVFLPLTSGDLEKGIKKTGEDFSKQFRAFVQIHNLMGCPLAVVPVDLFATEIVPRNVEFFENEANQRVLGLSSQIGKLARAKKNGWEDAATELLVKELFRQENMPPGRFDPCVDFGLFSGERNGMAGDFVWFGAIDKNGEVTYGDHPRRLKGVDAGAIKGRDSEVLSKFIDFGSIVKQVVFSSKHDPRELGPKERKYLKPFLRINPYAYSVEKLDISTMQCILSVKEQFCPWRFIYHALPSSAKQAVS